MNVSSKKRTTEGLKVRVKYLSVLRDKTDKSEEYVEIPTDGILADIVSYLKDEYRISLPDPKILLVLNGKGYNQYPERLETKLKDGDTILLLPPISGG
jgi:MoaD family protein